MEDINKLMDDIDVVDGVLIEWFQKRMEIVDKMIEYWENNPFDQTKERELHDIALKHFRYVSQQYQRPYLEFQAYLLKIAKDYRESKKQNEENSDNV
ncbi:MAG: hypothetical protein IJM15_08630 [Erysipelotrichaceae bacterium]|nr:hypothetical protein [Erysipelotrichaceae bacterium]